MSNIIDLEKYRRKKFLEAKTTSVQEMTNDELYSILMGVMATENLGNEYDEEAELQAEKDFEMYRDDEGLCKCLFCGSIISEKDGNNNGD